MNKEDIPEIKKLLRRIFQELEDKFSHLLQEMKEIIFEILEE